MKKILLLLFIGMCLSTNHLQAGGFKVALQGQKQTGMAGTGVGFAQDAATIYYNPAGLSFVNSQVNVGMNGLFPSITFLEKGTNTLTDAVSQTFTPFSLYANCGLSKNIKLGLGVYTPFGTGVTYPTTWSGRYILHEIELQTIFFQPTLSVKLSNNVSLGAGFIYSTGSVLLQKDLPINNSSNTGVANAKLEGNAKGYGFNAGIYVKASENLQVGASYHSNVNMKVDKGEATFSNIPLALQSTFPVTNTFKTELSLPAEVAAGLSYKLTKGIMLTVDYNYTFWKSFDSLGFNYDVNTSAVTDAKSPRLYANSSCLRIGTQINACSNVDIRAGLFLDQTPVKDGYVAPELPDNNKVGLTIGGTFKIDEKLHLNLSLLYEEVAKREQRNKESGLEGTFQTKIFAPGIGLSYLFQKRTVHPKNY